MKSVVICGSTRFKEEINAFAKTLRNNNCLVYEPYLHQGESEWNIASEEYKKFVSLGLTHDHFYKIKMADVVFVYNKDGYSGYSTTMEIGYAVACNKPIYALAHDEEYSRMVLFRQIVSSAEELIVILSK